MESKIKEANALIKEVHIFPMSKLFSRKQVIDLMKAAQRQAIDTALEVASGKATAFLDIRSWPIVSKESILSSINSPELEVTEADWAAKCLYNGLLKESNQK